MKQTILLLADIITTQRQEIIRLNAIINANTDEDLVILDNDDDDETMLPVARNDDEVLEKYRTYLTEVKELSPNSVKQQVYQVIKAQRRGEYLLNYPQVPINAPEWWITGLNHWNRFARYMREGG